MKLSSSKILITSFIVLFGLYFLAFAWMPTGYVGTTRKNGENFGCTCHGSNPTPSVSVSITGPDSVAVGQTVTYSVSISNGPAQVGGFNVAVDTGSVDIIPGDTTIKREEYPFGSGEYELTHSHPKPFSGNSVSWSFRYTAPNFPIIDTLYASGNSANNDGTNDNDNWNWSPNKQIRVYNPIGIINISSVARDFSISQNYPNPFNPITQINFSVARSSNVQIKVFDILGNETALLVNENLKQGEYKTEFNAANLASGTYFYSLVINGEKISTKKMLLVK